MKAVIETEETVFDGDYADMRRRVYAIKEKYPSSVCTVGARSWGGRALFTLGLGQTQGATLYMGCVNAPITAKFPAARYQLMHLFR